MIKKIGTALYCRDKDGWLERVQRRLKLSLPDGHYYVKTERQDGLFVRRKVIAAKGFDYINSFAGVTLSRPDLVLSAQGIETSNPLIERDKHGAVQFVRVREKAFGRRADGNLSSIDLTISYDVAASLATRIFDLWLERNCPSWGTLLHAGGAANPARDCGCAIVPGGNVLLYKLTNREVLRILQDHAQRGIHAEVAASTIVSRNLLRKFLGVTCADDDGFVEFSSWVREDDEKIADAIEQQHAEEITDDDLEEEQDARSLLRNLVKTVGNIEKCRELSGAVCREYGVTWEACLSSENDELISAVYDSIAAGL